MSPTLYHSEATDPLFTFFKFFQNAERRDRRREAIISGLEQFRAASESYIEGERPGAANYTLGQQLVSDSFRRRPARNFDVVVCFSMGHCRMQLAVHPQRKHRGR